MKIRQSVAGPGQVNMLPLLDATAPVVGIPTPGRGGLVFDRLLIQRGLRGVQITSATLTTHGVGKQRALLVLYTTPCGKGRALFIDRDRRDAGDFTGYCALRKQLESWAHRERHKRKGNCGDVYCKLNRQTITIASTPRERAELRYKAKWGEEQP